MSWLDKFAQGDPGTPGGPLFPDNFSVYGYGSQASISTKVSPTLTSDDTETALALLDVSQVTSVDCVATVIARRLSDGHTWRADLVGTYERSPASATPRLVDALPAIQNVRGDSDMLSSSISARLGAIANQVVVYGTGIAATQLRWNATVQGQNVIAGSPTAPFITSIVPSSGSTAGSAVTINGGNFAMNATVTFGGTPATGVTWVSAAKLTCTAPAHAAGSVTVVVLNPSTGETGSGSYTYNSPDPWVAISGCIGWWDTHAAAPGQSGGNLTTWASQIAGGITLGPADANAVPVNNTDANFGGQPSLSIGSGYLKTSSAMTWGPFTIIVFVRDPANSTGYIHVHGSASGSAEYTSASTGWTLYLDRSGTADYRDTTAGLYYLAGSTAGVFALAFDGTHTNDLLRWKGATLGLTAGSGNDPGTGTKNGILYIGGDDTGANKLAGTIAGVIVYNRHLTLTEIQTIETYANAHFGI